MVAITVALALPTVASAHAIVLPSASKPAELQRYTLTVPNERNEPTVTVRVTIPEGVSFVLVESKVGWKSHVQKVDGQIVSVTFDGGSIEPDHFDTFRLIAKNPVLEGTITWDVTQEYAGGEVVGWNGPPSSDTPAPQTEISEAATPTDAIDVASGRTAATVSAGSSGSGGRDTLTLVVALVALGAALVGLGARFLKGRPLV